MTRWVEAYADKDRETEIFHLDGLAWFDAQLPRRRHKCRAQSRGWYRYFHYIEKCACGAEGDGRHWFHKNERRKQR